MCYFDGSDNAYAIVIYARWVMEDGSVYGYLASKAKVRYTAYEMQRQYWPTGKKESGFFENFSETELGSSLTIRRTLRRLSKLG